MSSELLPEEIFIVRDGTRDDHYIGHENSGGHAKVGETGFTFLNLSSKSRRSLWRCRWCRLACCVRGPV